MILPTATTTHIYNMSGCAVGSMILHVPTAATPYIIVVAAVGSITLLGYKEQTRTFAIRNSFLKCSSLAKLVSLLTCANHSSSYS